MKRRVLIDILNQDRAYIGSQAVVKEIALIAYLEHPNICPLVGVIRGTTRESVGALVLPWMHHGNVTQYMVHRRTLQVCITIVRVQHRTRTHISRATTVAGC